MFVVGLLLFGCCCLVVVVVDVDVDAVVVAPVCVRRKFVGRSTGFGVSPMYRMINGVLIRRFASRLPASRALHLLFRHCTQVSRGHAWRWGRGGSVSSGTKYRRDFLDEGQPKRGECYFGVYL